MKKNAWVLIIAIVVFLVAIWPQGAFSKQQKVYVLKYASEYAGKHPTVINGILPWIERVKKRSNGRLIIQFFEPNALCPARKVYDALVAGAVDMTGSPCHWVHGKFPLNTAIQLPLVFKGAEAASLTVWDLYNKFPEWRKEFREVKILWQWASATFEVHTTKKLIRTLEDLKGMKVISINPQIRDIIIALGANPIEMPPHDAYLALERGMAEGMFLPLAPCKSFKITDVAKYHTIASLMCDSFYAAINKKKWDSLPPDLQKILLEEGGRKMAQICGKTLDEGSIRDAEWMKKHGHKFYVLPPAEKARWRKRVEGLHEKWVRKMEAKGYKRAREIRNEMLRLAEKYNAITEGGYRE